MLENLPGWAQVDRSLPAGEHPYLKVLPALKSSPALARIAALPAARDRLLERARVQIRGDRGYAFVDGDVSLLKEVLARRSSLRHSGTGGGTLRLWLCLAKRSSATWA